MTPKNRVLSRRKFSLRFAPWLFGGEILDKSGLPPIAAGQIAPESAVNMVQTCSKRIGGAMITIRHGSRVHRLLFLLSIAGEFPAKSLHLLGNGRDLTRFIRRLAEPQEFRTDRDGTTYATKLITISGKRNARTIRLYRGALPILNELHPKALEHYLASFKGHRFSDADHTLRNHRVSEALAMSMMAGIETRPYILPALQMTEIRHIVPGSPSFYIARDFKKLDPFGHNKTMYTRIVGALFYPRGVYAVYNTRDAVMKWKGMGEFKACQHLQDLARMNAGVPEVQAAMLLGESSDVALQTLIQSGQSRQKIESPFNKIYPQIHFIPMDENGIRLMRILTLPDWRARMRDVSFEPEMRPVGHGFMEYDAFWEGTFIYSHLDSDIARLIRFHDALKTQTEKFEVLCFSWQVGFLKEYLGKRVILKQVDMKVLEGALGL